MADFEQNLTNIPTSPEQFSKLPREIQISALEAYRVTGIMPDLLEQEEYKHSVLKQKIDAQAEENPNKPVIGVFSDVDETMIIAKDRSDDNEKLPQYQEATRRFTSRLNEQNIFLAAVSGRDITLVQRGQEGGSKYQEEKIPKVDLIIGAVGTEIYVLQIDGTYKQDEEYRRYLKEEIGFDRLKIYDLCNHLVNEYSQVHSSFNLRFQARDSTANVSAYKTNPSAKADGLTNEEPPQEFKISFNFEGSLEEARRVEADFRQMLDTAGLNKIKVVICSNKQIDNKTSFNVDLVPVSKKDAVNYCMERLQCLAVVAGDSGNDADMLVDSGHAGVVVGGAKPELQQVIDNISKTNSVSQITCGRKFTRLRIPEITDRIMYVDKSQLRGPETLLSIVGELIELRKTFFE